jgi:hypothetical protein
MTMIKMKTSEIPFNTKESNIEKDQVTQEVKKKIKIKVYREFKQLENSYNLDATRIVSKEGHHLGSSQYCDLKWIYTIRAYKFRKRLESQ